MHIVIKQFPVCKCPVYTFLLQSLSLDRLLEYEENSYTMKNENSKTSIKNLLCLLSALDMLETDVTGKFHLHTTTHTHIYKLQKDQGHHSQPLHNSLLIEEVAEKLLLDIMRRNDRK